MVKPSTPSSKKSRVILAIVLIIVIFAAGYEYYQQQAQQTQTQQSQQLQQEAMSALKQYGGGYDQNYSYVMFASLDGLIAAANHTTVTTSYLWTMTPVPYNATTISYSTIYTGAAYYTTTSGEFSYVPTYTTYSPMLAPLDFNVSIAYSIQGGVVTFRYDQGPSCNWQATSPNGPYAWSGCKQFVMMLVYSPSKAHEIIVLDRHNDFYISSVYFQFYFFYATYVGSA